MSEREWYDAIVIGGGCGGLGAAIYTSRSGLSTVLVEKKYPGGVLALTADIENYPGFFPKDGHSISGFELTDLFRQHAEHFGTEVISGFDVTKITNDGPWRIVHDSEGNQIRGKTIIIAVGSNTNPLPALNADILFGRGVSYCATCDAPLYRGKEVVTVGGGEAAFEEADFLTKFCNKVTIIHRRQGFRATPRTIERVKKNPKMNFILDTIIEEVVGDPKGGVSAVKLFNLVSEKRWEMPTDAVFVFIGYTPNTNWLGDYLALEDGYIKCDHKQRTSVPGVYACGDVVWGAEKQAVISAGAGATAAMVARNYIETVDW